MIRFKWLVLIFLIFILLISCQKAAPDRQVDRIRAAEFFSNIFRLEKTIPLVFPAGTAPTSIIDAIFLPNRVFCVLTGGETNGVYFFDVNGSFIKEIQPKDRLIREFGQPWQVETDTDNNICIFDLRRHKVFIFTANGEYLRAFEAPKNASSFKISPANKYYFNSPVSTDETTILMTESDGTPSRSFSLMPPLIQEILYYKTVIPDRPLLALSGSGDIFQAFPITNTINKFNSDLHFITAFQHSLQRYKAPDVTAWKTAAKSMNKEKEFNRLLSQTTLFTGLYSLTSKVLMAEFMNIADFHPRYLYFYSMDGTFLNGEINYNKDEYGEILRAEKERLFTCQLQQSGGNTKVNLHVFLIPRI